MHPQIPLTYFDLLPIHLRYFFYLHYLEKLLDLFWLPLLKITSLRRGVKFIGIHREIINYAAYHGYLPILIWCKKQHWQWNDDTSSAAAGGGHLEVVRWLHHNGCRFNFRAIQSTKSDEIAAWMAARTQEEDRSTKGSLHRIEGFVPVQFYK